MQMKKTIGGASLLVFGLLLNVAAAQPDTTTAPASTPEFYRWAPTPPMGWNSWDCYGAGVNEEQTLANADYMEKNLKSHGWNLITVDIQWYEPLAHTDAYRRGAVLETDENGRLRPAPNRFPSSKEDRSFKPLADQIHAKGLVFGIHLMRGIPRQCVDRDNTPILGTELKAADIVDKRTVCAWNGDMYGVDMSKPGAQEYYNSVFDLIASWDVDYVKVDDLTGRHPEIEAIRRAIDQTGRKIVFSISPGPTQIAQGARVAANANLWRISNDFWDNWPALYAQFARLDSWTPFRGPGHWPDADMIPFGNIRTWNASNDWTRFTPDEHYTLMSLWCIARSPLILGGNLPKNDEFTLSLLTNDEVLAVNQRSTNNRQVSNENNHVVWVADVPDSKDKYVALFNAAPAPAARGRGRGGRGGAPAAPADPAAADATKPAEVSVPLADLGLSGTCTVRDLWAKKDLGPVTEKVSATVNSHGAVLYRVSPTQ